MDLAAIKKLEDAKEAWKEATAEAARLDKAIGDKIVPLRQYAIDIAFHDFSDFFQDAGFSIEVNKEQVVAKYKESLFSLGVNKFNQLAFVHGAQQTQIGIEFPHRGPIRSSITVIPATISEFQAQTKQILNENRERELALASLDGQQNPKFNIIKSPLKRSGQSFDTMLELLQTFPL